jgi:hypothetical protein
MAYADSHPRSLAQALPEQRVDYLKKVLILTVFGLGVSAVTGLFSALMVGMVPLLQGRLAMFVIIMGSFFAAQSWCSKLVFGGQRVLGFVLAAVFQGVAMGYLLLMAITMGIGMGSPFLLIFEAMALVGLAAAGMTAYLWTGPREFSMLKAGLAALSLPMLVLMVVSFVFPIGGTLGILLTGAFVVVSAGGLLYQINNVLHRLRSSQTVEGAYLITMGVLVLFWNVLSLLMRLQRR